MKKKSNGGTIQYDFDEGTALFLPVSDVPGYPYKVIVAKDQLYIGHSWMPGKYTVNRYAARYYLSLHVRKVDRPALLEKAVKKERKLPVYTRAAFAAWLREHSSVIVGQAGTGHIYAVQGLRTYLPSPIVHYVEKMEQAGKWKRGSFLHKGIYENRPWWMFQFEDYCSRLYEWRQDVYGWQVLEWLNSHEWNTSTYDV